MSDLLVDATWTFLRKALQLWLDLRSKPRSPGRREEIRKLRQEIRRLVRRDWDVPEHMTDRLKELLFEKQLPRLPFDDLIYYRKTEDGLRLRNGKDYTNRHFESVARNAYSKKFRIPGIQKLRKKDLASHLDETIPLYTTSTTRSSRHHMLFDIDGKRPGQDPEIVRTWLNRFIGPERIYWEPSRSGKGAENPAAAT
jgi:hypothetical protein